MCKTYMRTWGKAVILLASVLRLTLRLTALGAHVLVCLLFTFQRVNVKAMHSGYGTAILKVDLYHLGLAVVADRPRYFTCQLLQTLSCLFPRCLAMHAIYDLPLYSVFAVFQRRYFTYHLSI